MTEDFITDSIAEDLEEGKPSPIKKILVLVGIVVVLAIFIVYAILGPAIQHIEGRMHSDLIQNGEITVGDFTVYFQGETSSVLAQAFQQNQIEEGQEMSVCLGGHHEGKIYSLTSLFYPKILQQSLTHVEFESCPSHTLVMLHSHPFGDCLASETDINTLKKVHRSNPDILMIIMCGDNRFALYY